jgi:type IV pilus assembly protein PilA
MVPRYRMWGHAGFTLIELMVVVMVVGVLLAIALPTFLGVRSRGQDAVAKSHLRTAVGAARAGSADPATIGNLTAAVLAGEEGSLTYLSSPTVSSRPTEVSVKAGATAWGAAVKSASGACFLAKINTAGQVTYGTTSNQCSGDTALVEATDPDLSGPVALELVADGSFETPVASSPFSTFYAPTALGPWTLASGSIDLIYDYWPGADGRQSVDLSGLTAGLLTQSLATTVGKTYNIALLVAANADCAPATKQLAIQWNGTTVATTSVSSPAAKAGSPWTAVTATVAATTSTSTLGLQSLTNSACGPAIDAVTVTAG